MIEEDMMKIVEDISQWKYQPNKFLQGDFKYVSDKGRELFSKVKNEFNTQFKQEVASIMELLAEIGFTKIDTFERSGYEWNPTLKNCNASEPKN